MGFGDWLKGKPKVKRSGKWRTVRKAHLQVEPICAVCGGKKKVEVHHICPVHIDPARELDPENLITLCERGPGKLNCHLAVGHLGNYKKQNGRVVNNAAYFFAMFNPPEEKAPAHDNRRKDRPDT